MRLLPLKLVATLLTLFEFVNLIFLAREEELFNPLLFSVTAIRIGLFLQFAMHTVMLVSGILLWFCRRIGLILFVSASLINLLILQIVSYAETGGLGVPRVLTWAPFLIVTLIGIAYRRSLRVP